MVVRNVFIEGELNAFGEWLRKNADKFVDQNGVAIATKFEKERE
jgi:hypothetical protein